MCRLSVISSATASVGNGLIEGQACARLKGTQESFVTNGNTCTAELEFNSLTNGREGHKAADFPLAAGRSNEPNASVISALKDRDFGYKFEGFDRRNEPTPTHEGVDGVMREPLSPLVVPI